MIIERALRVQAQTSKLCATHSIVQIPTPSVDNHNGRELTRLIDYTPAPWLSASESKWRTGSESTRTLWNLYLLLLTSNVRQEHDLNPFTNPPTHHTARYKELLASRKELPIYARMDDFFTVVKYSCWTVLPPAKQLTPTDPQVLVP